MGIVNNRQIIEDWLQFYKRVFENVWQFLCFCSPRIDTDYSVQEILMSMPLNIYFEPFPILRIDEAFLVPSNAIKITLDLNLRLDIRKSKYKRQSNFSKRTV